MTVMAFDGKYVAIDSRCTTDKHIYSDRSKKLFTPKNKSFEGSRIICWLFAGDTDVKHKIIDTIDLEEFKFPKNKDYTLWIITENSFWRVDDGDLWKHLPDDEPTSSGCGWAFALSAMHLGLSAKEAVKHTCKLDHRCGGRISIMKVRD